MLRQLGWPKGHSLPTAGVGWGGGHTEWKDCRKLVLRGRFSQCLKAGPALQYRVRPPQGATWTVQGHPRRICSVLSLLPAAVSPMHSKPSPWFQGPH